jgi:hypothetical protein
MISPDEARTRLHALIDSMPDEQVAMVWMTFQSMFHDEYGEEYDDEEEQTDPADE